MQKNTKSHTKSKKQILIEESQIQRKKVDMEAQIEEVKKKIDRENETAKQLDKIENLLKKLDKLRKN